MNINYIKKLLQKGERLTLEAKLAKKEVPKSLWESYSAFANTMGGTILLGVLETFVSGYISSRLRDMIAYAVLIIILITLIILVGILSYAYIGGFIDF